MIFFLFLFWRTSLTLQDWFPWPAAAPTAIVGSYLFTLPSWSSVGKVYVLHVFVYLCLIYLTSQCIHIHWMLYIHGQTFLFVALCITSSCRQLNSAACSHRSATYVYVMLSLKCLLSCIVSEMFICVTGGCSLLIQFQTSIPLTLSWPLLN